MLSMSSENFMSENKLCNVKLPFPYKLHEMLSDVMQDGTESIVSWQPHGKAFRVHKPREFAKTIMAKYFHQTHYKSFQRQLHIYGFRRITKGKDSGAYYHAMFVKGMKSATLQMTRCKIKGALAKVEIKDPDFYQEMTNTGNSGALFLPPLKDIYFPNQELPRNCVAPATDITSTCAPSIMVDTTLSTLTSTNDVASNPKLSHSQFPLPQKQDYCHQYQPELLPQFICDSSCHESSSKMMLLDDFEPRRFEQNRRVSIFGEGDEVFFAGKKFFFVQPQRRVSLSLQRPQGSRRAQQTTKNARQA